MYMPCIQTVNNVINLSDTVKFEAAFIAMFSTNTQYHVSLQISAQTFLELNFIHRHGHPNNASPVMRLILKPHGKVAGNFC
jgi:hypothetical protein